MAPPINAVYWEDQEFDGNGRPVAGRVVTILRSDGSPAVVFQDASRRSPLPSVVTSSMGMWRCYLDPGTYTISTPVSTARGIAVAEGLQANLTANLVADGTQLALGESTVLRRDATIQTIPLNTQQLVLTYFTAVKTEPITQVRTETGSTAAATVTLCRVGIYAMDAQHNATLVAAIANDASMWAATGTAYTRSLTSTFNKVAGQRYAVGVLCVGTTPPSLMAAGSSLTPAAYFEEPRISAGLAGQSDLPSSITGSSLTAVARGGHFVRLLP